MILIISSRLDLHGQRVAQELIARGQEPRFLDFASFGNGTLVSFDPHRPEHTTIVAEEDVPLHLRDVAVVWLRRPSRPNIPREVTSQADRLFARWEWRDTISGVLLSLGARFVNPPLAQAVAVKPWQLTLAARLGISIPDTLVSNAPEDVSRFVERHECVVHKTLTSPTGRFLETQRWTPDLTNMLSELPIAPAIFQSEIRDALDVRVTIVGSRFFAVAFDARSAPHVDSRLDLDIPCEVHHLSPSIQHSLLEMMRSLGLEFATIDLKLKGNEYFFLELNPQGQFLYVEVLTGLPITAAVAELLVPRSGWREYADGRFV